MFLTFKLLSYDSDTQIHNVLASFCRMPLEKGTHPSAGRFSYSFLSPLSLCHLSVLALGGQHVCGWVCETHTEREAEKVNLERTQRSCARCLQSDRSCACLCVNLCAGGGVGPHFCARRALTHCETPPSSMVLQ